MIDRSKSKCSGLLHTAMPHSDTGAGKDGEYLACRQRLPTADITHIHVAKGGLQVGVLSALPASLILLRFSKKTAQGKADSEMFVEEVSRQFSDVMGEEVEIVHHGSSDLSSLISISAKVWNKCSCRPFVCGNASLKQRGVSRAPRGPLSVR